MQGKVLQKLKTRPDKILGNITNKKKKNHTAETTSGQPERVL